MPQPVAAGGPVAATAAVRAQPGEAVEAEVGPAPRPELDLDRVRTLWPAAVDAVRLDNAMVGALLAEARPIGLDGDRLAVCFPEGSEFSKRKAEANAELLQRALHGLTGHSLRPVFELGDTGDTGRPPLTEDQLLERLKQEFGAQEIFDDDQPEGSQ